MVRLTVRADRWTAVVVVVLVLAQSAVVVVTGLSLRWLVDGAVGAAVPGGIAAAVALGAAAFALRSAGMRVQTNMLLYLTTRVTIALTEEVLRRSADIPTVTHLDRAEHLDRLDRLRREGSTLAWLPWTVLGTVTAVLSVAASVVLLGSVHPLLSPLALLAAPPLLTSRRADAVLRDAQNACTEIHRREQRLHDLHTDPGPAKELFVTGGGQPLGQRADDLWNAAVRRQAVAHRAAIRWHCLGWLTSTVSIAVALLVVDYLVRHDRASLGDAVLVFSLTLQLQTQIRTTVEHLARLAAGGQLVDDFRWLSWYATGHSTHGVPPPAVLAGGIALHEVAFRYPGSAVDTLRGVNLWLPAGNVVALVGDNGAGKSTLVKLLAGVYEPTAGHITVDGEPLHTVDRRRWQARVSGVVQDFARFQFPVRIGIGIGDLPALHDKAAVLDAATRAGADRVISAMPQGMETQLGRAFGGVQPSPGQWQLLALARGLMRRSPLLLVLDEPTAALDPQTEYELFGRFVEQVRLASGHGTVTLLVSHRLTTVRMADLIVVLKDGVVAEVGTHGELVDAGGGYAELFRIQENAFTADPAARRATGIVPPAVVAETDRAG
jgi:ATP-binding cassette subfamily B protein